MKRVFLAFAVASWAPHALAAETFYCPWADHIVKLELNAERDQVRISGHHKSTLAVVKRSALIAPYANTKLDGAFFFSERAGDYVYDYELFLHDFGVELWNRRSNVATGEVIRQRGWCMALGE